METKDATVTIYLDIETWSGEPPSKNSIVADGRLKDPVKIADDINKKWDEAWRKQSLDSMKGEVWCIGIAVDDGPTLCLKGKSEKETMQLLEEELIHCTYPRIVGHNILEFDALWLFHKGLKYGLGAVVYNFSGDRVRWLVDTMKIMKGPAWKVYVSLDNMAKTLGFEGKGAIDGSMVHDMVLAGKDEQIMNYCKADVNLLRKCYKRLNELGLYS